MTVERAIEIMKDERERVDLVAKNLCNKNCANCVLLTDGEEILNAYDEAISVLTDKLYRTHNLYSITEGKWIF